MNRQLAMGGSSTCRTSLGLAREKQALVTQGMCSPRDSAKVREPYLRDWNCLHAAYPEYHWNGQGIDAVFEVNRVL